MPGKEQANREPFPTVIQPIAPRPVTEIPDDIHRYFAQLKISGGRGIVYGNGTQLTMTSRQDIAVLGFPHVREALQILAMHHNFIFDGEFAYEDGRTDDHEIKALAQLGTRPKINTPLHKGDANPYAYFIFDILYLDGQDLRKTPFEDRQEKLQQLISSAFAPFGIFVLPYQEDVSMEYIERTRKDGYEGVVFKKKGSLYTPVGGLKNPWAKYRFRPGGRAKYR